MATDHEARVWVGIGDQIKTLDTYLLNRGKIVLAGIPQQFKNVLKKKFSSFFFDAEGNSWFVRGDQVQKITKEGQVQIFSAEQGLRSGNFNAIFQDREGITWVCSDGNGVIKISSINTQIINKTLAGIPIMITALRHQNDTVWLYNARNHSLIRIYKNEIVSFPYPDKAGVFDLFILGQKIYLANPRKLIVINDKDLPSSYKKPKVILNNPGIWVGSGITDGNGALLIMTTKHDTSYFLTVIKNDQVVFEHPVPYTTDQLAIDKQQQVWIAPRTNQLIVFKLQPKTPGKYLELAHDYSSQLPSYISSRSITIDKNNIVWLGTRHNGIYRLEIKDNKKISLTQFSIKNGLTDNFIYFLTCDNQNNIWAGTQSGIDKILLKDGKYVIANISKSNNLFQTIYRIGITSDHTAWAFNNNGGMLKILATQRTKAAAPPLLFTRLTVNDSAWNYAANRFTYLQNNLSFSVAAASFFDERSILYSYQLVGSSNSHWSEPAEKDSMLLAQGTDPSMMTGMSNYGSDPTTMISLYKVASTKGQRKIYTMKSGGAFSMGKNKSSDKYTFSVKKIREGYWELVIDKSLPRGEYAFVVIGGYSGGMDALLFAFGID